MNRRDFLKLAGAAGVGLVAGGLLDGCGLFRHEAHPGYTLPDWTGDNFVPMHRIRDGKEPPVEKPSQKTDLVIVGGGMSGLTAAYYLRDEDFLLLEREKVLGGNAKGGEYQGVPYSIGAAYMVSMDKPFSTLYDELGLPLKPVIEPDDTMFQGGGKFVSMADGKVAASFKKLRAYFQKLVNSPDFPPCIIETATPNAMKLDNFSLYEFLKNDYPDLIPAVDAYCYSALGGGVKEISAYAGVNFYSEIAGDIYAFPGGNSFVAKTLAGKVERAGKGRILTEVSVYHVEQKGDRVWVSYFPNLAGKPVTVECKAVILAVPYFFAGRILFGWPAEETAFMRSFQYDSYLVANLCFDRRVFGGGGYDNWTPGNPVFTDFIPADYARSGAGTGIAPDSPYVLTVYAPFHDAMNGRYALLKGDKEAFAQTIYDSIRKFVSFPVESLKEIRLTRYGHQLLTSRVGLIRSLRSMKKSFGRVVLSHSDGQGMAAIESAIAEAVSAVKQVKGILADKVPVGA